jgi:hypothetical protein
MTFRQAHFRTLIFAIPLVAGINFPWTSPLSPLSDLIRAIRGDVIMPLFATKGN